MTTLNTPLRAEPMSRIGFCKLFDANGNKIANDVPKETAALIVGISNVLPVLIEAAQDVIDCTPENRSEYPDGPCIEKNERRALVTALVNAKAALAAGGNL